MVCSRASYSECLINCLCATQMGNYNPWSIRSAWAPYEGSTDAGTRDDSMGTRENSEENN